MKLNVPFAYKRWDFSSQKIIPGYDSQRFHRYAVALSKELLSNASEFSDCEVRAIRLGGGTASLIAGEDLVQLVRVIRNYYHIAEDAPITMRASMSEINGGQLPFYRRVGIHRYDIELMSMERRDFSILDYPNHIDWVSIASASFLHAETERNMGFVLLYGHRDINAARFRHSLVLSTRTHCSHIELIKCAGPHAGNSDLIDSQMREARDVLPSAGYREYLPCRWAKEGCEDFYAQRRAHNTDELAFGLGAVTRFDGSITANTMDIERYLRNSDDFAAITVQAIRS